MTELTQIAEAEAEIRTLHRELLENLGEVAGEGFVCHLPDAGPAGRIALRDGDKLYVLPGRKEILYLLDGADDNDRGDLLLEIGADGALRLIGPEGVIDHAGPSQPVRELARWWRNFSGAALN